MQQERIRRVLVWSGWLRLSHWLIAFGVLFEILSAWAVSHGRSDLSFWLDWHKIVGQLVLAALVLRIFLLFFPGAGSWRVLFNLRGQLAGMLETARCYMSLMRLPLPNWYAHNPLWKPVYPFMYLSLLACALTGLSFGAGELVAGHTAAGLHAATAKIVLYLSVVHMVTACLHDWKGRGCPVSGMISGYRYFHYPESAEGGGGMGRIPSVQVSLESIGKRRG